MDTAQQATIRLFFVRPLLSKTGGITEFPATQKQTQRGRQNETEEHAPIEKKKKRLNHSKRPK